MLDFDLLRSFVSVVDTGGFTSAGERVHRTQSTVSQQIKRLEESLGYPLLHRDGKQATPTEQGERLVSYARRLLALEQEARDVVARPDSEGVVRLGDDIEVLAMFEAATAKAPHWHLWQASGSHFRGGARN